MYVLCIGLYNNVLALACNPQATKPSPRSITLVSYEISKNMKLIIVLTPKLGSRRVGSSPRRTFGQANPTDRLISPIDIPVRFQLRYTGGGHSGARSKSGNQGGDEGVNGGNKGGTSEADAGGKRGGQGGGSP